MGHTASPTYAYGQLQRAVRTALSAKDGATRKRAQAKASQWQDVLTGMAAGSLRIGSRTPVADTPAWITLEVVHGGFATGRFLAEVPLSPEEAALSGTNDRERLNLWYLTDGGLATLRGMLATESYRIEVPEDAALPTVAWLLEHGHAESALDLIEELRPYFHRLRLAPLPGAAPRPAGASVRLSTVGEVRESLRSASTPPAVAAMLETLKVWHPLFDRLVALWCDTVEGDLPRLDETGVTGGWPCRTWPRDWQQRRGEWLADYASASAQHTASTAHAHPKSNFARLHRALLACEHDSTELTGRDVGWIRRALANTITKHGEPDSEPRAALRALQASVAARPIHAELAAAMVERLDRFPADGGLPSIEPVAEDAPAHLVAKVARALEAPIEELVARKVITSADVLATVLPQITAQLLAANFDDEQLSTLYAQTYAAFRHAARLAAARPGKPGPDRGTALGPRDRPAASAASRRHPGGPPDPRPDSLARAHRVPAGDPAEHAGARTRRAGETGRDADAAGGGGRRGHLHGYVHREMAHGSRIREPHDGGHGLRPLLRPAGVLGVGTTPAPVPRARQAHRRRLRRRVRGPSRMERGRRGASARSP